METTFSYSFKTTTNSTIVSVYSEKYDKARRVIASSYIEQIGGGTLPVDCTREDIIALCKGEILKAGFTAPFEGGIVREWSPESENQYFESLGIGE